MEMVAEQATDTYVIRDLEEPLLPLDKPEIEATCHILALEEIDEDMDIAKIIQSCLEDVK